MIQASFVGESNKLSFSLTFPALVIMKKAIKLSLGRGKETTTAGINYGLCIGTVLGWDTYLHREKEKD